jgi:phosphohistidine swiveling domain-containing protein
MKDQNLLRISKKFSALLEKFISERMKGESRKDAEFRGLIVGTEIGDLQKYTTHDPKINRGIRPHGSKEDEILAFGQAFIQLAAWSHLRKISIDKALEAGIKNWLDRDWKAKKATPSSNNSIKGITAYAGKVEGEAFLANDEKSLFSFPGNFILVTPFLKPDHHATLVSNRPIAIITDHGGQTSHSAIIARELSIICVVGTGKATKLISHGSKIRIHARKNGEADIFHMA